MFRAYRSIPHDRRSLSIIIYEENCFSFEFDSKVIIQQFFPMDFFCRRTVFQKRRSEFFFLPPCLHLIIFPFPGRLNKIIKSEGLFCSCYVGRTRAKENGYTPRSSNIIKLIRIDPSF